MRLTLLEGSRTIGDLCSYDVAGLPAGEHAKISYFSGSWRVLRWNGEWHGNWAGNHPTADAALDALRQELQLVV